MLKDAIWPPAQLWDKSGLSHWPLGLYWWIQAHSQDTLPLFYQSINLGRLKLSVLFKPRIEENKVALVKQKSSAIYSFKDVCSCLETASK